MDRARIQFKTLSVTAPAYTSLPEIRQAVALLNLNGQGGVMQTEGPDDLAYVLNGTVYYYKDKWAKIQDEHFPECPVSTAAADRRISTLCVCDAIEKAEKEAVEQEKWERKLEKGE